MDRPSRNHPRAAHLSEDPVRDVCQSGEHLNVRQVGVLVLHPNQHPEQQHTQLSDTGSRHGFGHGLMMPVDGPVPLPRTGADPDPGHRADDGGVTGNG